MCVLFALNSVLLNIFQSFLWFPFYHFADFNTLQKDCRQYPNLFPAAPPDLPSSCFVPLKQMLLLSPYRNGLTSVLLQQLSDQGVINICCEFISDRTESGNTIGGPLDVPIHARSPSRSLPHHLAFNIS